jgi:hypothetical protein
MLNNPVDEINRRQTEEKVIKKPEWLFTKSRILFLISVFIVFLLPLIYRYFSQFL